VLIETSDGRAESIALKAMAVSDFQGEFMQRLRVLGILQETYVAAAELAKWDRKTLERELEAAVN
jgi:hypothetical protein